jgi:hypothetical protein
MKPALLFPLTRQLGGLLHSPTRKAVALLWEVDLFSWRFSLGMLARSPMAPNSLVLVYVALWCAAPHCLVPWADPAIPNSRLAFVALLAFRPPTVVRSCLLAMRSPTVAWFCDLQPPTALHCTALHCTAL